MGLFFIFFHVAFAAPFSDLISVQAFGKLVPVAWAVKALRIKVCNLFLNDFPLFLGVCCDGLASICDAGSYSFGSGGDSFSNCFTSTSKAIANVGKAVNKVLSRIL